ncbi:M48 family metallopeptidase [Parahalioglobus pacificus]|uniref:Peptidase M48 domain-containing protein n=1 Tax=Parahalioglobus pacificus TaxID=930806 RepID=A0A918XHH7_9GAMM|nr:M48 family metallopeptidase [Halioglobus pacificus]GHD32009.1 hypothetical protein GCM10007053_15660 [Halioglobus pacificus]
MRAPRRNPRLPEGINAPPSKPLSEFLQLSAVVLLATALLAMVVGASMPFLARLIPFAWEQGVSGGIESYLQQSGSLVDSADAQAALSTLGTQLLETQARVLATSGDSQAVPQQAYRFALIDDPSPNAFATLGAQVMVTRGLLDAVKTENGLAMVLAHEIAHVELRHPLEAASRSVVLQVLLSTVLGSSNSQPLIGLAGGGALITALSFNRSMELKADAHALNLLQAHYGHTRGADEFFVTVSGSDSHDHWRVFFETHPGIDARIEAIRAGSGLGSEGALTAPLPAALRSLQESASSSQ